MPKKAQTRETTLIAILVLLLSILANAQEEIKVTQDQAPFDYAKGNYDMVKDWSTIEWDKVDYRNPTLALNRIPKEYAERIDVTKAINAGKGHQLTLQQIEANTKAGQEGIIDLTKLNKATLHSFFKQKYKIMVDLAECKSNACSLKETILENRGKGKLPLDEIKDSGAQVRMLENGNIEVIISKSGSITSSKNGNYLLHLQKSKKAHSMQIDSIEHQIRYGRFRFKDGKMFILEGEHAIKDNGIIFVEKNQQVEWSSFPLSSDNIFDNKIYIGKNSIELSGSEFDFIYTGKGIGKHKSKLIRNGHQLIFEPRADQDIQLPSKISFNTETREVQITGDATITNGNERIRVEGGHFISEVRTEEGIIQKSSQQYNLFDMIISFTDNPDKKIAIKNNNIHVGEKAAYYSSQFNEYGFADIKEYLGPRIRDKAIRPTIVIISPRTRQITTVPNEEQKTWETIRQSWLINRKPNQPVIFFDLDTQVYSPSKEGKIENQEFIEQLLGFAQMNNYPINFMGHSEIEIEEDKEKNKKKENYKLLVNNNPKRQKSTLTLPKNLFYSGERLEETPTITNPVIAGCACAPFIGKETLDTTEYETVNMYVIGKNNAEKPEEYNWKQFVDDLRKKRLKFPSQTSCEIVTGSLHKFYKEFNLQKDLPELRKICA